jgi:hypothetical protein
MAHRLQALLASALLLLGGAAAHAEIYRYTDAQGREHFTTDLQQVPDSQRGAAKAAAAGRPPVIRKKAPAPAPGLRPGPPASRQRASTPGREAEERRAGHPESWWREQHGALESEIAALEAEGARLEEMGADNMPPSARRRASRRRYANYRERHFAWKAVTRKLQQARDRLERFEERARRSDVPPGWLR